MKDNLIAIILSGLSSGDEKTKNETLKMMKVLNKEFEKMREDKFCSDCEREAIQKYADLATEYDKLKRYNKILNDCLDTKDEYCKVLREDNENLRYKNELYLEKIKKLEKN